MGHKQGDFSDAAFEEGIENYRATVETLASAADKLAYYGRKLMDKVRGKDNVTSLIAKDMAGMANRFEDLKVPANDNIKDVLKAVSTIHNTWHNKEQEHAMKIDSHLLTLTAWIRDSGNHGIKEIDNLMKSAASMQAANRAACVKGNPASQKKQEMEKEKFNMLKTNFQNDRLDSLEKTQDDHRATLTRLFEEMKVFHATTISASEGPFNDVLSKFDANPKPAPNTTSKILNAPTNPNAKENDLRLKKKTQSPSSSRDNYKMSMDRKFRSDTAWYISGTVHIDTFIATSLQQNQEMLDLFGLPAGPIDDASARATFANSTDYDLQSTSSLFDHIGISYLLKPDDRSKMLGKTSDELNMIDNMRPDSLKTHEISNERLQLFKTCPKETKSAWLYGMKYYKQDKFAVKLNQFDVAVGRSLPHDCIISVTVNAPNNRMLQPFELRTGKLMRPQFKFLLRGDTLLYDLRQRINCPCDLYAHAPDGKEMEPPRVEDCNVTLYPSSFIFIHDTFYIDTSIANSIDISKEIREFLARKPGFGPTKVRNINGVRMRDLTMRLGQPYLFMHSGNCEHLLTFTDLRMMTKDDVQELQRYPLPAFEIGPRHRCHACKRMDPMMAVEDNSRLPYTPAFFCEPCYRAFHYNHSERIGDFRAFQYHQITKMNI